MYRRPTGGPVMSREPRALEHLFAEYYTPQGRSLLTLARLAGVAEIAVSTWLVYFAFA
jgi:hypothetical protein